MSTVEQLHQVGLQATNRAVGTAVDNAVGFGRRNQIQWELRRSEKQRNLYTTPENVAALAHTYESAYAFHQGMASAV